jgi:2-(1,2-epoxy-1,2-dihydrophenyl)acetyl-CoA isomerase
MSDEPLQISREGPFASIRLTQPKILNAIDFKAAAALTHALRDLAADSSVRVVVLSGEGRAFMAGGDLSYLRDGSPQGPSEAAQGLITQLNEAVEMMATFPIPLLACVHGAVAGAGLSLMLACDFAIAADDTRFVFGYTAIGTSPDGGLTWALPRVMGLRRALEFAFLNQQLDATAALHLGLVQQLAPSQALSTASAELAARLSQLPLHAFGRTKKLLLESQQRGLREQLNAERESFVACARTHDFREGLNAFLDRRLPHFSGN